ncbi:MAG: MBL fold metallo-hydrolase, partial [Bryobacteraceae bacterium]
MKTARIWIAGAFALLGSLAFFAARSDAKPETVQQIMSGIWFREGDLKAYGHCNNIIIEMKDYLIVVDANFPSGAKAALADAKRVSSKPVKYVFDTHHHGDHAYGNAIWTQAGATTLAYKGVAEEMKRYEPKRWQEAAKTRKDVAAVNAASVEPPRQTFDKSPFVLEDSTRRVEFHFFGWAHTRGDGFVYLPKEQVICTGDAVTNGPYNYTGDAHIGNWPNVARAAQKLKVAHVLP